METSSSEPLKIAGYTVERIFIGNHTLGKIDIGKDVTVVFRLPEGGGLPGWPDRKCAACIISNIGRCRDQLCPGPNCNSEAIGQCASDACRAKCGSQLASWGNVLVLA